MVDRLADYLVAEAERLGACNLEVQRRGLRHSALIGQDSSGKTFRLIFAGTPSDRRTGLNLRTRLRRLLNAVSHEQVHTHAELRRNDSNKTHRH